MAGKKKVEKDTASWMGNVQKHSRQIWLAGLGAYVRASAEGSKAFDTLVKEGEKAEKLTRGDAAKLAEATLLANNAKASLTKTKVKPASSLPATDDSLDSRLQTAISQLGVPGRDEITALNTKVDQLTQALERLIGNGTSQATAAPQAKLAVSRNSVPRTAKAKPSVGAMDQAVTQKKPRARKAPAKADAVSIAPGDLTQP